MKLGAHLMRFDSVPPAQLRDELAATADAAEAAGLSWLSVMDHYFQMERAGFPREDPMLEAYTTLGFLAGRTSTVRLGVLVTGVDWIGIERLEQFIGGDGGTGTGIDQTGHGIASRGRTRARVCAAAARTSPCGSPAAIASSRGSAARASSASHSRIAAQRR